MSNIYDYAGNPLLEDIVTPEMYGAKGDGITDDTLAIKQALSGGSKTVGFSNKTYYVHGSCNIYSKTHIIGNGARITTDRCPFIIGESGDYAYGYQGSNNVLIEGLYVDLNGLGTDHIIMAHAQNITIKDCVFYNNAEHSIELNSSKNVVIENCVFKSIAPSVTNKEAINIDPAATGYTISMGYFDNTISDGVRITNCFFDNCWAAFGNHGTTEYASKNIIFTNNDVRNCYKGVHMHSYENVIVQDNIFYDISDVVVRMKETKNVHVSGNIFSTDKEFVSVEGTAVNAFIVNNIGASEADAPITVSSSAERITVAQNIINDELVE